MADIPMTYPSLTPVVNDFSRDPTIEKVVHEEPPRYEFLNPLGVNNAASVDPSKNQYQPQSQSQWGAMGQIRGAQNMHSIPSVFNSELAAIETYQIWSILNILFCCLCLGCVACYYSSETENSKLNGDIQGALNASRNARTINIIATVLGMIIIILNVLYYTGTF